MDRGQPPENGLIWWDRLWRREVGDAAGRPSSRPETGVDEDAWFLLGPSLAGLKDPAGRVGEQAGPRDLIC